jgi:cyclic pyranopterin phosphate synthase
MHNTQMTSRSDPDVMTSRQAAPVADALGRPLHDLRISLLDQCNFRCPYCMPEAEFHSEYEFLKKQQRLTYDEIIRVAVAASNLGVSKIRLTGGEPLLDKNICELIERIATLPGIEDLALTTNGMLLEPIAGRLKAAGLHRVTISLDSIDKEIFRGMSGGRGDLGKVLAGIEAAENAGLGPIKINVVVQKGVNDHTILELLRHFRGTGTIVRLIEFMDVGNRNGWRMNQVVPSRVVLENIQKQWPLSPIGKNYPGEVARRYEYVDGAGEIGFISSVTEPFCGDFSRPRF